ncbi:hypothetical protein T05_8747 [Trichinella murrelli]|uniref:Uncharacterized protein n=1 Tax=Trichinella murrelli TaxID=144512 RepID=A0A0V0UE41_9BILA|nr:hypothetical protein T05_8747 [Trichinella murrelli]
MAFRKLCRHLTFLSKPFACSTDLFPHQISTLLPFNRRMGTMTQCFQFVPLTEQTNKLTSILFDGFSRRELLQKLPFKHPSRILRTLYNLIHLNVGSFADTTRRTINRRPNRPKLLWYKGSHSQRNC